MAGSSFGAIIGIVLFVLGCKTIVKTYKKSPFYAKFFMCIGLFIGGVIIAILFSFLLNPDISPEALGETSIIFGGFFANLISLTFAFLNVRNHNKKDSKEYKSTRNELVWSIIIPVVVFAFLFGSAFYSDVSKEISCEYPKTLVGDECCFINTDFGIPVCSQEAEKMTCQLNNAVENEILTERGRQTIMNNFSLIVPEGYFAIKDIKAGYLYFPLYLVGYSDEGEIIAIKVLYASSSEDEDSIYQSYEGFKEGLLERAPNTFFTEPNFLEDRTKGFKLAIFNSTSIIAGVTQYSASALITSDTDFIIIQYTSDDKNLFDYYYNEFEEMYNSLQKI